MDTLHTVLRSIRGETKARRDHLAVFREFLSRLDRVARLRGPRGGTVKANGGAAGRASGKRGRG